MVIKFKCNCGRELKAGAEHAGTHGKCPSCGAVVTVPTVEERIKVACPECKKAYMVSDEAIGRSAKCSACGKRFPIAASTIVGDRATAGASAPPGRTVATAQPIAAETCELPQPAPPIAASVSSGESTASSASVQSPVQAVLVGEEDAFEYFDETLNAKVCFSRIGGLAATIGERGTAGCQTISFGQVRLGFWQAFRFGATGKMTLRDKDGGKWTFSMSQSDNSRFMKWLDSPVPMTPAGKTTACNAFLAEVEKRGGTEMVALLKAALGTQTSLENAYLGSEAEAPSQQNLVAIVLTGDSIVICRQCSKPHPMFPRPAMRFGLPRFRFLQGSGVLGWDFGLRLGSMGQMVGCRILDDAGHSYAFGAAKECVESLVSGRAFSAKITDGSTPASETSQKDVSGACDICSQPTSTSAGAKVFTNEEMKRATERGFNGMAVGVNARLLEMVGISGNETYGDWRRRVMLDTTDWLLCPVCQKEIRRYK